MKENLLCKTCGTPLTSETANQFCSAKCANSNSEVRQKMTEARNQKLADAKLVAINDPILSNQEFVKILELGVSKPQSWEPFLIKHKAYSTFLHHKLYNDEIPSETLYRLQNNITERPFCECGGNHIQFRKGKDGGYIGFCSTSCSALLKHNKTKANETCLAHFGVTHQLKSKEIQDQIKQTCLERHGVEHPLQSSEIMNKRDATMVEKFGVKHAVHSIELMQKTKETCMKRYGTEHSFQSSHSKAKMKETYQAKHGVDFPSQAPSIRAKIKSACLERYGVDNPSKSKVVIDKIHDTHVDRYGCYYNFQHPTASKIIKQSMMQNHGVEYAIQSESVKLKMNATMISRYGFKNWAQTGKANYCGYKWKPYTLPSGNIAMLQGYENHLFDSLLQTYDESEIFSDKDKMPLIWYEQNGTIHRYFPDFYIPKDNIVYEVKSDYTFIKGMIDQSIILKAFATHLAGYNYELQILNQKGETVTKIRVNFSEENIKNTEGINLSWLCNHFVRNMSDELKEKLKEVSPAEYFQHFKIIQVEL